MLILVNGNTPKELLLDRASIVEDMSKEIETKKEVEEKQLKKLRKEVCKLEKSIAHLKKNRKRYMRVVTTLALIFMSCPELAFADDVMQLGNEIINKINIYMGMLAAVLTSIEISSELIKGGRGYWGIMFKYGGGYVALLLVPKIYEILKGLI